MFNLQDQQIVKFDNGLISGYGKIVGVATTEFPVIGRVYLIEVHSSSPILPNETYPFRVISMPEAYIKH